MKLLLNKITVLKNGGWNSNVVTQYLDWLIEKDKKSGLFFYSLDNNIGFNETREGIGAILSEEANDYIRNIGLDDKSILILYRIVGSKEKDWDGEKFWVPLFKFPSDHNILYNLDNN
ncbi:hypothetical protein [Paenibacillus massiliensis]|uniref:hypothetical protein n=1 Tax=Paenibacillus massiliensis TaxID=225917 RepID=UPI0004721892|nr:hypothetical protein [Paenibacillus massiliensis]